MTNQDRLDAIETIKANAPFGLDMEAICFRFYGLQRDLWIPTDELANHGSVANVLVDSYGIDEEVVSDFLNYDYEAVDFDGEITALVKQFFGLSNYAKYTEIKECDSSIDVILAALCLGIDIDNIDDSYHGYFESDEDFAQNEAEERDLVPEHLWGYINWEVYAVELGQEYSAHNGHYFHI